MRILAVEEDTLSALLLHELLEREGHTVQIVPDGETAWQTLLRAAPPEFDLVISTWTTPQVDGMELCRRMRGRVATADTPLLLFLEVDTPLNRQRALDTGVSGFLAFPADEEDIRSQFLSVAHAVAAPPAPETPPEDDLFPLPPPALEPAPEPLSPPRAARENEFAVAPAPSAPVSTPIGIRFETASMNRGTPSPEPAEPPAPDDSTLTVVPYHDPEPHSLERPPDEDTDTELVPDVEETFTIDLPAEGVQSLDDILSGRKERLGEILIARGLLSPAQLKEALDIQAMTRERLGTILVGKGWVTEEDISAAYSRQVEMPFVDVETAIADEKTLALLSRAQALQMMVLPLETAEEDLQATDPPIRAAIADPWNTPAIDLLHTLTRRRIKPVLAEASALRRAIELAYNNSPAAARTEELVSSLGTTIQPLEDEINESVDSEVDQAPIIRLVNTIIGDAVRRRASDIHIEPYKHDFEVRYRIDGQLHTVHTLPRQSLPAVVSRIKVIADMDIAEKRVPQDGRVTLLVDNRPVQFRISTLPNQFGERIVLRVLDKGSARMSLEQLSFSARNLDTFENLIRRPHGILLVTGPTGSGKTTTLYAALNAVKSPMVNIMTCEDPIEYEMDRISQSMVNAKAGLTFAAQLRAILRQDPDVVLVGEIRDGETAEIAFKAAMTGHLVLSTLHCNEAAGAPTRLIDMGVEPFLIGSGLLGAIAQRLVLRLCPNCRQLAPPTAEQRALLDTLNGGRRYPATEIGQAVGCSRCSQVGTFGRLGIHELLVMNEQIQQLIMQRATTSVLQDAACAAGMVTMVADALEKVVQGEAYLDDVRKKVVAA